MAKSGSAASRAGGARPGRSPGSGDAGSTPAFRAGLDKITHGELDDRRITPDQLARASGLPRARVESIVRKLGDKGAVTFDHATAADVAAARGFATLATDNKGQPYHGFRVERPARFEQALRDLK